MKELNVVQMEEIDGGQLLMCGVGAVIGGIGIWSVFVCGVCSIGIYGLSLGADAFC